MDDKSIPQLTLDARMLHAPEALRLLARKERATKPAEADRLEAEAKAFEAWRARWIKGTPA